MRVLAGFSEGFSSSSASALSSCLDFCVSPSLVCFPLLCASLCLCLRVGSTRCATFCVLLSIEASLNQSIDRSIDHPIAQNVPWASPSLQKRSEDSNGSPRRNLSNSFARRVGLVQEEILQNLEEEIFARNSIEIRIENAHYSQSDHNRYGCEELPKGGAPHLFKVFGLHGDILGSSLSEVYIQVAQTPLNCIWCPGRKVISTPTCCPTHSKGVEEAVVCMRGC